MKKELNGIYNNYPSFTTHVYEDESMLWFRKDLISTS